MERLGHGEGQLCNLGFMSEPSTSAVGDSDYRDGIVEGTETNNGKDKEVCGPRIKMMAVYESAT